MDTAYIQTLSTSTSTDISKWNLQKIFGNTTDRCEINKRFFAQKLAVVTPRPKRKPLSLKASKDLVQNLGLDKLKMAAEVELKRKLKESENLASHQSKLHSEILALRKKLRVSKDGDASILMQQVQETVKDGFWENPIFTEDSRYLWFNAKNDAVVHNISKSVTKDNCVNFGKFAIRITLDGLKPEISFYKDNIDNGSGDIHPFVSLDERDNGVVFPCYGNAYALQQKLRNNMELSKLLKLTVALLISYNSEYGYAQLEDFEGANNVDIKEDIRAMLDDVYHISEVPNIAVTYHPHVWKEYGIAVVKELMDDERITDDKEVTI